MARISFSSRAGRVRTASVGGGTPAKTAEDVIREIKKDQQKPPGEDYRDRSLAIHGMICGRCGREFDAANRHLLTVHHKDHNHQNNPPDGSNWENLCVYCHDDAHSRSVLGEYVEGAKGDRAAPVAYSDPESGGGTGLGDLLQQALARRQKKG